MREIRDLAKTGADSVLDYIERTAEKVPTGFTWQTLGDEYKPHYHFSIFNGVAGICFFLGDYYGLTGKQRAMDLALGGAKWCSTTEKEGFSRGLYVGRTGVGMAWLHLSRVLGRPEFTAHCEAHAKSILGEGPGPVTDMAGGAAGNGLFLSRLWDATKEERFKQGAIRIGEWFSVQAVRDENGCHWPMVIGEPPSWYPEEHSDFLGYGHGIAGGVYFLLSLYEITGDERWADLSKELLATLMRHASPDKGGLNWPRTPSEDLWRCQWCHGAPGIGLVFARAYEVLDEISYLQTAEAAGETTFAYGDVRGNPSQCHGLAGNAELFIELYRITGHQRWIDRAFDFARQSFRYQVQEAEGVSWQADEPGYCSPDFLNGAAGTGHFFLRLLAPDTLRMPLS